MVKFRTCGPRDRIKNDENNVVFNVTSGGDEFSRKFSPMKLGPVKLYGPFFAFNVENAWQYTKVYKQHVGSDNQPSPEYFEWAENGWLTKWGQRHPMGKGTTPAYAFWDGQKMGYLQSRREIYLPLYRKAVLQSGLLDTFIQKIKHELNQNKTVWLFDYDCYDYKAAGVDFEYLLNDETKKLGHGLILHHMIEPKL